MKVKISIIFLLCIYLFNGCTYEKNENLENETEGDYFVSRINDSNESYDSDKYFYYCYNKIYYYDFETKQNELICCKESPIYDLLVWNEYLYYVISEGKDYQVIKYNYVSQEESVVFTSDMCIQLAIDHDYLFYKWSKYYINMCPVDGDFDRDSISVNELFESDDYSGEKQSVLYEGISITRYFDEKNGKYVISEVRDHDTQRSLFLTDTEIVMSDASRINFYSEYDGIKKFYYQKTDGTIGQIDCLSDEEFELSDIFSELLTEDQGQIIGLISVSTHPLERRESYQEYVKRDVLFKLDPKTGESSIIYNTENNQNRIIGYQDGVIYLFGNNTVYSMPVEGGEKTELFTLASGGSYVFDWQEGYLIVRNGKEPYEVIEIWEKE